MCGRGWTGSCRAFPTARGRLPIRVGVLAEFGVQLEDGVEVRVVDSTADIRYLLIRRQPAGAEALQDDELAALMTRDSMIGVAIPVAPTSIAG